MRTTQLSDLYQHQGPFASVTLDVSRATESGAHEHELRVRDACQKLIDADADGAVVDLVSRTLREQVDAAAPVARTVVATADGVLFDQLIHAAVDQPSVAWGPLPEVSTWIEHEDATTDFVLAVVDHVGGDVGVYTSDVPEPVEESSAGGETTHVHKVPVGGWSALRYQRETENVWRENAKDVAAEIVSAVRRGPRLVLLAGDPQSRGMVLDALEGSPAEVVQLETGSRAEDGGDEALQQAIRQALLEHTVARRVALNHTLKDRMGADNAVALGVSDVAQALVRGQVDTLLLDPRAAAEQTITPKDFPGLVVGTAPAGEALPADQALVAAAACTGAEVAIGSRASLGGSPVAALLRWDQDNGAGDGAGAGGTTSG